MAGRSGEEADAAMAGVATGGVEDAYGEDRATEDQPITPWAVCIARYIHTYGGHLVPLVLCSPRSLILTT